MEQKKIHSVIHAGGMEFPIYYEYSEALGEYLPDYPDLE
jgi:hypothetical protein